jgi:hypothetical protein
MALQAGAQSPLYGESSTFLVGTADAGAAPNWASGFAQGMETLGPVVSIFGAVNGAIGSFYAAQNQQNQLRMQAQNQAFAAEMGRVNQRAARYTAAEIGRAGQERTSAFLAQRSQARAGARAAMASRGLQLGVGSAKEVIASMDITTEIDRLSMSAANVRAQEAAKLQAFNIGTQAMMSDISAQNLRATANTIYPGLALGTSLLGSAADIGSNWARNKRIEELLSGVSTQRL